MMPRVEYLAYVPTNATHVPTLELMRRVPERIAGLRELPDGQIETCLIGYEPKGPFYGYMPWELFTRRPLFSAWVQRDDFAKATDFVRLLERESLRNLQGGQTDDEN